MLTICEHSTFQAVEIGKDFDFCWLCVVNNSRFMQNIDKEKRMS